MLERYGSEEGLSQEMARRQVLSREKYSGDGGLRSMSPEKRAEISRKGVEARRKQKEENAK